MSSDSGYVELVTRLRLWAFVPEDERVTEDDLRRWHEFYRGNVEDNPYFQREMELLKRPVCEIAVRAGQNPRKWKPCGQLVAEGEQRCKRHGGSGTARVAGPSLRAELERLRAILAENGIDA